MEIHTASILLVFSILLTGVASQCLCDDKFKNEHRLAKLEAAIEDLRAENLKFTKSNLNVFFGGFEAQNSDTRFRI